MITIKATAEPRTNFQDNAQNWTIGIDNSNSQAFTISPSNSNSLNNAARTVFSTSGNLGLGIGESLPSQRLVVVGDA